METRSKTVSSWRHEVADSLRDFGFENDSYEFRTCGDVSLIQTVKVCSHDPAHFNRAIGHSCHLRVCQECARRESARLLKRYLPHFIAAAESNHPKYRLRAITLTTGWWIRDADICDRYREGWRAVSQLFENLFGERWAQTGRGTFTGCEFGEDGQKLHFHVLAYCEYIDQERLSDEWQRLTGFPVVWIKAVYSVKKALKEVIKYSAKLTDLEPDDIALLHGIIKGTRRIRTRGIFYNIPPLPKPVEQLFCPICKAPVTNWEPLRFEVWRKNHDSARRDSLLHSIPGNKSGNSPPVPKSVVHRLVNATDYMWDSYEEFWRTKK